MCRRVGVCVCWHCAQRTDFGMQVGGCAGSSVLARLHGFRWHMCSLAACGCCCCITAAMELRGGSGGIDHCV